MNAFSAKAGKPGRVTAGDLELWGGAECTVNRVGDGYRDQLRATGHHDRLSDFALIAGLGIRTIRFPVLWERVAPGADGACDWAWSDIRMAELARLCIRPVVGLLHHGSGPAHTSLIDDAFPALFARYAAQVAARYPQVRDWTPINEPLTTARFATLYRTWYPHAADRALFWRAMVIQTEATMAAMRAIRQVTPDARLVQTDDLGETTADAGSRDVADYYNARRWLGWDLLAGRVRPGHPLWDEGAGHGFADRLLAIAAAPCPADIIGIDHYPTSDRHLVTDGDGYRDEPALRASRAQPPGLAGALRQAWDRYRTPLVVTECHLGCTREEQIRWLRRAWDTATVLRNEGVGVRAVTVWAMFGSSDWDSLLTVEAGSYESGAFDARAADPRPTALARLAAALGGVTPCPPVLDELARQPGWWECDGRFGEWPQPGEGWRPILITDGGGPLPAAFAGACRVRGLAHVMARTREEAERLLGRGAWAVIDIAGWTRDAALAGRWSSAAHLTDIFAAEKGASPAPCGDALRVHAGDLFSPFDAGNPAMMWERALASGAAVIVPGDRLIEPTYTPDLARVVLDLIVDGERGTRHLSHGESITPLVFVRRLAEALGFDPMLVTSSQPVGEPAPTPAASCRGDRMLPPLNTAIRSYAAERLRG